MERVWDYPRPPRVVPGHRHVRVEWIAWTYPDPSPASAALRDHVASRGW